MSATAADLAGLLRAVVESPGDDAVRLVYADALEEKGEQARADFIRLQLELEKPKYRRADVPLLAPSEPGFYEEYYEDIAAQRDITRPLEARERVLLEGSLGLWCAWSGCPVMAHLLARRRMADGVVDLLYRRGFVAEVCCTLAQWFGEACQYCHYETNIVDGRCKGCKGTGRIHIHGPAIVLVHPVESVTLIDREPLACDSGFFRWTSRRVPQHRWESWELPDEILKLLPSGPSCTLVRDAEENWASRQSVREYTSRVAAVGELGVALVRWARKEAGLP